MGAARNAFIGEVVAARGLIVTSAHRHAWRLEPRESALAWHVDLDDGWTPSDEKDPPPSVHWVCPPLRVARDIPFAVTNRRDRIDLSRVVGWLARRAGRSPEGGGAVDPGDRYDYTDPHGIIDAPLRERIEHWSAALHDHGVAPAELSFIKVDWSGLRVSSTAWWDSAAALDHQIALAVDIADRLAALRPPDQGR